MIDRDLRLHRGALAVLALIAGTALVQACRANDPTAHSSRGSASSERDLQSALPDVTPLLSTKGHEQLHLLSQVWSIESVEGRLLLETSGAGAGLSLRSPNGFIGACVTVGDATSCLYLVSSDVAVSGLPGTNVAGATLTAWPGVSATLMRSSTCSVGIAVSHRDAAYTVRDL